MYKTFDDSKRRWGGYSEVIDYWLALRQEVLVSYSQIAGLNNPQKNALPSEAELTTFCSSLIDYISAGHFRVYNKVMERWKANGMKANPETDLLYFKIVETTKPLVEFNDKYADSSLLKNNFLSFDKDISDVGEIMALRFELEDQLIHLIAESVKN